MAEDELRMTLETGPVAAAEVVGAGAMEVVPDGQAEAEAARMVAAWESEPQPTVLGGKMLTAALIAISRRFDTVSAAQREQMRVLTAIRQACDAVPGVREAREAAREAGAAGAVRVLVRRHEASEHARSLLAAEVSGLRRLLAASEAARESLSAENEVLVRAVGDGACRPCGCAHGEQCPNRVVG